MNAHFDTREFVAAHGAQPRGRGSWIFESRDATIEAEAQGTYAAARAQVARQHPGVDVWFLLP